MQPADLAHLRLPSDPQVHPDGRRVAFVVSRLDVDEDHYERHVWMWDGETARPFTHGPFDSTPRFSPDGQWLAFLRKAPGDDEQPQVVVLHCDGGEAVTRLTDFPAGASALAWAPDSRRIAVIGNTWVDRLADLEADERKRRPRRVLELPYRADNIGYVSDVRSHLYVVERDQDVRDGNEPTAIEVDDRWTESAPAWTPDGEHLLFVSSRHDARERDGANQIWRVAADGGDAEALTAPGFWVGADVAPDGTVHAVGLPDTFDWPDNIRPFTITPDGTPDGRIGDPLVGEDRMIAGQSGGAGLAFRADGTYVTQYEDSGRVTAVAVDGSTVTELLGGDRVVTGVSTSPDGSLVACTVTTVDEPGELHLIRDGEEVRVTSLNADFHERVTVAPTTHRTFEHEGLTFDLWTVLPPGDEQVPLLLNIHGGPTAQYGFGFFDEFQVYAVAGHGVAAINPRGASGRGKDFMRAVVDVWHTPPDEHPDLRDLRAAVAAALDLEPRFDAERVGVMGGSYGGYMTAWMTGTDTSIRSAVVERALLNWESFGGTSDIGSYFDRMFVGATLPDGVTGEGPFQGDGRDKLRAASPVWLAKDTVTPTLVLHSEGDWRCPIEQAEQYFALLRRAGCTAEFLRFPGESHELSRSGSPKHRIERFEAILDWHARHLA